MLSFDFSVSRSVPSKAYAIFFSAQSITRADLDNPDVVIVFKDASGNEEVFRITDFEPQPYQGVDISFMVYLRSTERPSS